MDEPEEEEDERLPRSFSFTVIGLIVALFWLIIFLIYHALTTK